MGRLKPLKNDLRRPVYTEDGEQLISSRDLCLAMGNVTQDRARQVLREVEPYSIFGNVILYRRMDVEDGFYKVAPAAAGLVPQKYITFHAGIHNTTLRRMLPQLPKPAVEKVTSDNRIFRWWHKEHADYAVEKIIRIHRPRKIRSKK